ncbi:hypothetical protein V2G26_015450 [Clonostachys chloroleuca]
MARATPFHIKLSDGDLAWITERVRTTRLPAGRDLPADELWKSWGLPVEYARKLKDYWVNEYDWRRVERKLNEELEQYTIPIDHRGEDLTIHFVHHRSPAKAAIPLLIVHGWPGSVFEIKPIIRHLTHPTSPEQQAYHVVVPSLPGFGFSSYPSKPCSPLEMPDILCKLMTSLGYSRFMAQGGDWGAQIVRILATRYPTHCPAVHLNCVVNGPPNPLRQPIACLRLLLAYVAGGWGLDEYEKRMLGRMKWFLEYEAGSSAIQGTKPLTVSYGLTDSPFGMMCWLREKLEGAVGEGFEISLEDSITWAMPYIINGSPGHAEIYKWMPRGDEQSLMKALSVPIPSQVAFGASIFPNDVVYIPRWWAEGSASQNIIFWKQHEKGGHFPCFEVPEVLAEDIRAFTRVLDKTTMGILREFK